MKCDYCKTDGATWSTPELKRICFNCMRKQRDELKHAADQASIFGDSAARLALLEDTVKRIRTDLERLILALEEI